MNLSFALTDMGAQPATPSPSKPLNLFTERINSERVLAYEQRQDPRWNGRYSKSIEYCVVQQ